MTSIWGVRVQKQFPLSSLKHSNLLLQSLKSFRNDFGKNCVHLCVWNNLILKVYISHQENVNEVIFHYMLNLQIDSASGCWFKKRYSQDCRKNFFGQTIESDARAFQSSLKCRSFDPSWQHSIRESRTYFNMFRPIWDRKYQTEKQFEIL